MRILVAIQIALLLSLSMDSLAARVEYQHPGITIVAAEESLDSVLSAVGKEMQITVTVPIGVNPTLNCDIHNQPLEQAFKTLLGDLSYSLTWEDGGDRLLALTIHAGNGESAVAVASESNSHATGANPAAPVSAVGQGYQGSGAPVSPDYHDSPTADHDAEMADHRARMEAERTEHDARMAEERAAHEAEMEQRREEEEIAHEARMREEVARKEAESAELFEEVFGRRP